ncbi:hypothetical protein LJD40_26750, partial [Escherichia coli]|nr:hypothetical protein [Escherichia coli]
IVIVIAVWMTIRVAKQGKVFSYEDPEQPSKIFAPAGLFVTKAEKELQAQWDELPESQRPVRSGH